MFRLPCKDYLKGTCTNPFCEKWHPPECLIYKSENGCKFGDKCSFAHRQVEEQSRKRSLNNDENWVAYFRIWSHRSLQRFCGRGQTYGNQSDVFNSQKAVVRHADIRDQNPPLGMICPGGLHQLNPNAPKIEDRSQEETEWQEQGAREAAWRQAKSVLKLKEHERATFFSPSENRCLFASTLKPEEREFVVDSGASMHMTIKKDLNDAEMDSLTKSCSPTIVITANGEVQTHEEAIVLCQRIGYIS